MCVVCARVRVSVRSGVSRFLELSAPWRYSKKEKMAEADYRAFNYALVGPDTQISGFTTAHTEMGFSRVVLRPPFFLYEPKIKVLQRRAEAAGAAERRDDFDDL